MSPVQIMKRGVWRVIYPVFPYLEHTVLFTHRPRRQRFHLGWLAPGKTLEEMQGHLASHYGFGNHFVAWEDPDQVLSWRKLDGFDHQYHLRVFADGELRGHYEMTPEAAPLAHFLERGEVAHNREFRKFLGPYLSVHKHVQNPPLKKSARRSPEITFEPNQQT